MKDVNDLHQWINNSVYADILISVGMSHAPDCGDLLASGFKALYDAGFKQDQHLSLYRALADEATNVKLLKHLIKCFKTFRDICFIRGGNRHLYRDLLLEKSDAYILVAGFKVLKEAGFTGRDYPELYRDFMNNLYFADQLTTGFKALKEAGFTGKDYKNLYQYLITQAHCVPSTILCINTILKDTEINNHQELYQALINNIWYGSTLAEGFKILKKGSYIWDEQKELYQGLISNAEYAHALATSFIVLKRAGYIWDEQKELYQILISRASCCYSLARGFEMLISAGFSWNEYQELYQGFINKTPSDIEKLGWGFIVLKNAGFTWSHCQEIYQVLITHASSAFTLASAFKILNEAGYVWDDHQELYQGLIRNEQCSFTLGRCFEALKYAGFTWNDHQDLYQWVLDNASNADKICDITNTLLSMGASYPEYDELLKQALYSFDLALPVLSWLKSNKCTVSVHFYLFHAFFTESAPLIRSLYNSTMLRARVDALRTANPVADMQQLEPQIKAIIEQIHDAGHQWPEGPLNKSAETIFFEKLLIEISKRPKEQIKLRYDATLGYLLQLDNEPEIHLSSLLRLTNFNHIGLEQGQSNEEQLNEQHINALGGLLEALTDGLERREDNFSLVTLDRVNIISQKLPIAAQRALQCYTSSKYKNINRIFRGVALDNIGSYAWITPTNSPENFLANFLCSCLVNWAAAKLPLIFFDFEERRILESLDLNIEALRENKELYLEVLKSKRQQDVITSEQYDKVSNCIKDVGMLFPSYGLVDRGERILTTITDEEGFIGERRLANPTYTSAVLSLSVFKEGSKHFNRPGTTRTKIETANEHRPIINVYEGEILVPHGTSYLYTQDRNNTFFAREINSPAIIPQGDYWSAVALNEAYKNHLCKEYREMHSQVLIDGIQVNRPNHGLAHTYRVMIYIDVVIDYFAKHTKENEFKEFCQNISRDTREWLRVAAAYGITGRENEKSAGEDLQKYDGFRQSSENHLREFLEKHPPRVKNAQLQERICHIVRWMGNPAYECTINKHENEEERKGRNFLHRILTTAHKLDLPRCYCPEKYAESLESCRNLSASSAEQEADYQYMLRYVIDLNRAHGNALCTTMNAAGGLEPCSEGYRFPFGVVSTKLKLLHDATETVHRPVEIGRRNVSI